MRRAVQLNVFFIVSSLAHLTATESTLESVTESEEEDSTIKSQIDLDDGQKFSKLLGANDSESEFGSGDNQTWSVSYDDGTELANYTRDDYSLSNRNEVPKSGTTARRRWEEPEPSTIEGAQSQIGAAESDITERSQWGEPKSSTTGRNWWGSSANEGEQPEFSTTVRNRWEKIEFNTTEEGQPKFSTTERNQWEEPKSGTTEGAEPKFSATGRNRWEEPQSNTTERSRWEKTEFNTTQEAQPRFSTIERSQWEEPKSSTTEGAEPKFSATGRNWWEEPQSNTTERSRWEKTEFNTTEETQPKFSTIERSGWEEPKSSTTEGAQPKFSAFGSNRWEDSKFGTTQQKRWEESEFGNDTEVSNYTEWASEELSAEANTTSYFTFEQEPTTPRQPLLYRNYGDVNDTKDGWHVTLYDENKTPCLKMNLQIVINVYFIRNNPRSRLKGASFIQTLPTSPDDLTVEGECDNGTSLLFISWKTSNLTWRFDQGENGAWSMREVELTVTNPHWFEKYNFCDGRCHPFSLKSGNGSWYDSSMRRRQVNVPLSEEGATTLKADVFLMDTFRAEPFARN